MDSQEPQLVQPKASLIPGVLSLVFLVPNSELRANMMPTPMQTLFKDCKLPNKERVHDFSDYVFVENEDADNHQAFRFVPRRTDGEINTPITSMAKTSYQKHPWDDVLLKLGAIEDPSQPMTIEVDGVLTEVPRLFGRYHRLPGGLYSSMVEREVFVSHTQFPDEMKSVLMSPVPTEVQWHYRNLNGSLNCLHGDIEFEETQTDGRVLDNWGTVNHPIEDGENEFYPATNPTRWVRHCFDVEESDPIAGMRRLIRQWVTPPSGAQKLLNSF